MPYYAAKRVSAPWQRLLIAAEHDRGRRLNLNSGRRTMAEQTRLRHAYELYKAGRGPWAPVAAIPSPTAPHIRVGRVDHALDIEYYSGDTDWFMAWLKARGLPSTKTVPGEAWHVEASSGSALRDVARKWGQGPKELGRDLPHRLKLSARGLSDIANFEGYRAHAYEDAAGHATIGFGHLLHYGGLTQADRDLYWDRKKARAVLEQDTTAAQNTVRTLVKVPLTQPEFDALVSFVFNVGPTAFRDSTLLKLLNEGRRYLASAQFLKWNHAGNKVILGLSKRRRAERALFLTKKEK